MIDDVDSFNLLLLNSQSLTSEKRFTSSFTDYNYKYIYIYLWGMEILL